MDFAQRFREKTAELRAENEADWAEGDEETPPRPGRAAAERLGSFLHDLGSAIQKGTAESRAETEATDEREASDEPTDEESRMPLQASLLSVFVNLNGDHEGKSQLHVSAAHAITIPLFTLAIPPDAALLSPMRWTRLGRVQLQSSMRSMRLGLSAGLKKA